MIRLGKKSDDKYFVEEIAFLTYEILRDLGIQVLKNQKKEKVVNFLKELYVKDNNRFSYHNTLVKELNGHAVGIAIIYHGKNAEEYDNHLVQYLQQEFQLNDIELSKETEEDEFYLDSLAVSPLHRKQGIGSELLKAFENIGEEEGHQKLALNVDKDNETAYRLYKKNGFEFQSTFDLYGHPYLHMVKNLK
ncbi:GNAT family N-acetyltransferase [Heyndrickxia camelliae]|uniref:GNAT family N-acetyltransferase n=1 Tax=Heyndrickxia camelliae TaxID=1707093 RepID=UPI001303A9A8|nr:GNAT family N-acetyltransferase [Heyndrickxia camelliae]